MPPRRKRRCPRSASRHPERDRAAPALRLGDRRHEVPDLQASFRTRQHVEKLVVDEEELSAHLDVAEEFRLNQSP